ncbi:hypothetical protein DICSQDRAFT_64903, partial [Dichomitus squalens LYAD-421 SS1]
MFHRKIQKFCEVALRDGFDLCWLDFCCIDKSSSTELAEAINVMYTWYRYSTICYAYLGRDIRGYHPERIKECQWFKRGWTLQELIAPNIVLFLDEDWEVIGSKHSLAPLIEEITSIHRDILTFERLPPQFSVAERMMWASERETTREEDGAYCLMGLFQVNITIAYGEGSNAFIRLQEEILRQSSDQTLFAW